MLFYWKQVSFDVDKVAVIPFQVIKLQFPPKNNLQICKSISLESEQTCR